LKILKNKIK